MLAVPVPRREFESGAPAMPIATVGMPVYNGEKYIREALESLLSQSFPDFELIVSDNASEDATAEIVRSYADRDDRIRLTVQAENIGAAANFEYVLEAGRGRFFMWAAHDDIWAENWLEVLLARFDERDAGIRGRVRVVRNGTVIVEKTPPELTQGRYLNYFLRNENDYRSHYTYSLFDREKLLRADISTLDLDYYPDALFVYEVLKQGNLRTVPDTFQTYRVHEDSLGIELSRRRRGLAKILYRVHPARYYRYYLRYTDNRLHKAMLIAAIPLKHVYAQLSFWVRGARQLVTGVERV